MKEILAALAKIKQPGPFCARDIAPGEALRIRIDGLPNGSGALKWPLSARAVKALIKIARPDRFGWSRRAIAQP